jgi:hypothetical protein
VGLPEGRPVRRPPPRSQRTGFQELQGIGLLSAFIRIPDRGRLRPYSVPKRVKVEVKIVKQSELVSPGTVKFSLEGKEYEFVAFDDEERGTYFLVFGDETNGMETYDGGRFLDFKIDTGNQTVLNFNRAFNPPCAFSDYATCPLPPAQNRFPFRLETGEKKYKGHD